MNSYYLAYSNVSWSTTTVTQCRPVLVEEPKMAKTVIPDEATLEKLSKLEFDKARQQVIDLCMDKLHINQDKKTMRIWPRRVNLDDLLDHQLCDLPFKFVVDRDPCTGEIVSYREVVKKDEAGTGQTSLSLRRAPGPPGEDIMGSSSKYPFFPGGMEDVFQEALKKQREAAIGDAMSVDFEHNLLTVPPGFEHGVDFKAKRQEKLISNEAAKDEETTAAVPNFEFDENADILSIMAMISGIGAQPFDFAGVQEKEDGDKGDAETNATVAIDQEIEVGGSVIEEAMSKPIAVSQLPNVSVNLTGKTYEYAIVLDVSHSVKDFHEKVPTLAHKYPFELDIFQKQAIINLEHGDSVFVAAHTSAGKTVVAEYAIALCKKHYTRAIYTSPIKALSNQKFHDFKQTFGDVGLITGDIQLNKDAFCLIMTTEILRSMLYNGSDVIREVEWVIFDEVHYVNDSERGVVWEEVLIMLPRHVKIIMLSATVQNFVDFANWVGSIKDRKVYVISTLKRPVPLEHFLYTGKDGKTKDNRFMIVNKDGTFMNMGYNKAMESVKDKKPATGPKNFKQFGVNQNTDKNIWITLINHLETKELLPMVAFTFSRKRCQENADMLTSVNLTTAKEKQEVHYFFSRCIRQLHGNDRKLPQLKQMQELCKRGLAVHHSGILPILKEVIEMLFQQGYIKVLFATETFAMGVNMPARTVVFDSMMKFDGKTRRDLTAGEYTQMAGRAGRRGKDKTGTVILLCKGQVPEMSELHKMMKGKADLLESKFRVTYSLVLNSLRVDGLRIEEILQRSFGESGTMQNKIKAKEDLELCKEKLDKIENLECAVCSDLEAYYDLCRQIVETNSDLLRKGYLAHPDVKKQLTAGRLVLFSQGKLRNCVGIVLKLAGDKKTVELLITGTKEPSYTAALDSNNEMDEKSMALLDLSIGKGQLAQPVDDESQHSITTVPIDHLLAISSKTLKISSDGIMQDWSRRQQPRFRNSSPDRATVYAVRELCQLIASGPEKLNFSDPTKDVQYADHNLQLDAQQLKKLRSNLSNYNCINCLCFQEHFLLIHRTRQLEAELQRFRYQLSTESLEHMPLYNDKLKVLRELRYVDENNVLMLKGKVAASMNVFELIVTELMLENVLNPLTPVEIAAALSFTTCQGVQYKDDEHLCLPQRLAEIKKQIDDIADRIYALHKDYQIPNDDFGERLRFELMEVTYEWALGTPFFEIMTMTDVDEGIIVRCIQRLDEVARDVRNAAKLVGEHTLQQKMEEMSTLIKRDIVFAASLYTTM